METKADFTSLDDIFASRDAEPGTSSAPVPVAAPEPVAGEASVSDDAAKTGGPADTGATPEPTATDDAASRDERARDEHGRFAKGDPAVALRQERDRNKGLVRENAELGKRLSDLEAKMASYGQPSAVRPEHVQNQPGPARQPSKMPDPAVDPDGFEQWLIARDRQRDLAVKEEAALSKFGPEKVQAALQAAENAIRSGGDAMAWLYHRIMSSRDPFAEAIAWAAEEQARAAIGNDMNIDALKERIREEVRAELAAASPQNKQLVADQQPKPAGVMPTRLGATPTAGSSGSTAWAGPRTLDEIFAGRG